MIYCCLPFLVPMAMIKPLLRKPERNPLAGHKLSGERVGYVSKDYSTEKVKQYGKANKATINDVIMAVISTSLKEYFVEKGDEKCKELTLSIPFSLRQPPKDSEVDNLDPHIKNEFSVLLVDLPLVNDLVKGMPILARTMGKYKTSLEPIA